MARLLYIKLVLSQQILVMRTRPSVPVWLLLLDWDLVSVDNEVSAGVSASVVKERQDLLRVCLIGLC